MEKENKGKNINLLAHLDCLGFFWGMCKKMQKKNVGNGLGLVRDQALQQEYVKGNTYSSFPS